MPVTATTIRQIELQLYKAEQGLGMPYDADRVAQLRGMLRDARKQKLSQALAAKRPPPNFFRQLAINYRQLAEIAGNPEIKQRMIDMAAHYQAKADEDELRTLECARRGIAGLGEGQLKSLLLTICIAALATPAIARPWHAFYCGKL